jgi:uncharacterized protein (TIGR03067 family)
MKTKFVLAMPLVAAVVPLWAAEVEPGFKSLFNGKDLAGWAGRTNHWSVEDGAITGVTTKENPARGNNFLIAKDGEQNLTVGDFELRLSYRFTGTSGNSGIQFRSQDKGNFVVHGYQADMEVGTTYSGILYEEGGRGLLCQRGQKVVIKDDPAKPGSPKLEVVGTVGDSKEIQAAIKVNGWNDYVVIARGNHIQQFINGKQTVEVTDEQEAKAAKSGILALQIHQGDPMKIQFKDIRLKPLATGQSDLEQMQGDWVPVEIIAGERVTGDVLAGLKLKIKGNEYTLEGTFQDQGRFKLNETTSPKSMDVTSGSGSELPAIYEVSGTTFKVAYAADGAPRPKDFKPDLNAERILTVYKRKQP